MRMNRAESVGPVRGVVGVQWAEAEAFHEVRRSFLPNRQTKTLFSQAVIASANAGAGTLDSQLLLSRPREKGPSIREDGPHRRIRHAVVRDDEETDTFAALPDGFDHALTRGAAVAGKSVDRDNHDIFVRILLPI